MEQMLFVLDMIGTVAFALSGAMTAIKKKMDILGVMILGMVTAVGGGMMRDIILGIVPPQAFREPFYAVTALLTSMVMFVFIYFRERKARKKGWQEQPVADTGKKGYQGVSGQRFAAMLMAADTLGLGVFTVVGVKAAFDTRMEMNYFLPVFLGMITGVGGGLLRDMMAGDRPYIFVKHVYACASILGAFVCAFLWTRAGEEGAMIAGAVCVIVMRVLAIGFKWNLPRIDDAKMMQK